MQAFARHSFLGLFFLNNKRAFLRDFPVKPPLEQREARCIETTSLSASRLSLYENGAALKKARPLMK